MAEEGSPTPVVADINVLVRALEQMGPSFQALAVVAGSQRFGLWLSDHIVDGTLAVLRKDYPVTFREVQMYSEALDEIAQERGGYIDEPAARVTDCPDWEDNRILELAYEADARLILSEDYHLTDMHPWRGTAIMTPREFVDRSTRLPEARGPGLERMEGELRARLPVPGRHGGDRGIGD